MISKVELNILIAKKVTHESLEHLPLQYQELVTENGEDGASGFWCPRCGASESQYSEPCIKRYSTNINVAWEIDKKGWNWSFDEYSSGLSITIYEAGDGSPLTQKVTRVDVLWDDFPNKKEAYAYGRCIAALKAAGYDLNETTED